LVEARLLRRYKRFLADVEMANGDIITVHCPNTGAMTGCAQPGSRVWLSTSTLKTRKYPHTWELVETSAGMACIHSAKANKVVREAFESGMLPGFDAYPDIRSEVKYGENSRADLLLQGEGQRVFVEVKSVTLLGDEGWGAFPDAVSERGRTTGHLRCPDPGGIIFLRVSQWNSVGMFRRGYRPPLPPGVDRGDGGWG